jgi:sarcosine oxidase, subunit alpha
MSPNGPYRVRKPAGVANIPFTFNGKKLYGIEGDTVASALLANGMRVVSRSFKYHRPRGIFSAGYEEPNSLVQIGSGSRAEPCARSTLIPLVQGLEVTAQSGWPSLDFDALRAIDFAHSMFAAGFYNKTFMWPNWHVYEPLIRKLAGFGRAPTGHDPDRYETHHCHCDVLIIGGGPAGIEAAQAAAIDNERVMLVEQGEAFGGEVASLRERPNVQLLIRTAAVAYYDHELIALAERVVKGPSLAPRERLWVVRARRVVLATGAVEQPLIFSNNDRPGIMLASAALTFLRRHGVAPGRQVVVATNNDSGYAVVRELRHAAIPIVALIDSRDAPPEELRQAVSALGIPIETHCLPVDTHGFGALKRVSIGTLAENGGIRAIRHLACDALLVSGGFSPTLHLFAQAGGKLKFSEEAGTLITASTLPFIEIVGNAARTTQGTLGVRLSPVGNTSRQWLDLRHDVTVADIELSVRENLTAVEHIKRHTTLGMSVDQGKLGQATAIEAIARAQHLKPSELGHTTFRPPFVPVTLGTMVGRNVGDLYAPYRRSPLYTQAAIADALFEDFGEWQRAAAFPNAGESREEAMIREVTHVRERLGLYDASPLGKIELIGPDALEFADRFYINNLSTLKKGRARYGIMLRETGVIFDDGTVVVLDDDRVLLTTTSSGAVRVSAWLEEWRQCEWPTSRVSVIPVTDQWGTVALTGQQARQILKRLKPECDVSNGGFPHLGFRETILLGGAARIYRVSFSGELTYEINVPAHRTAELWDVLLEEGREFGIEPYGVDALLHLRMEKGFLHLGTDTDGTTLPDDVGFGKPATAKGSHFIGKRSLSLPDNLRADRLQLIGLRAEGSKAFPVGSHLRLQSSKEVTDGWVTSAGVFSGGGQAIGLGMLRAGRREMGGLVSVYNAGRIVSTARVVAPVFYDVDGARMHA